MIKRIMRDYLRSLNKETTHIRWYDDTDLGAAAVEPLPCALRKDTSREIMAFFDAVDPFYSAVTGPLSIAGAWKNIIRKDMPGVVRAIEKRDLPAYEALLCGMFRNEVVSGLWNYGYFADLKGKKLPSGFLAAMDGYRFITGKSPDDLFCSRFGNPWGLRTRGGVAVMTAPDTGIKVFGLLNLLGLSEKSEPATVVDLGSGYGADMAQLAQWHPGPLRMILLDIPINLATAYAFLSENFREKRRTLVTSAESLKVELGRKPEGTEFLFVPSLFVEGLSKERIRVVHNHGSLSEMDMETIAFYLRALVHERTDFFVEINSAHPFRFDEKFVEVDSRTYPVPSTHRLLARTPTWLSSRGNRYLQSLYIRKAFLNDA